MFSSGSSTPDESQVFAYDGGHVVLELDGTTDELDKSDLAHRYLWAPGPNHLLVDEAVESLTDADLNESRWALSDHLGTIRDWVDDDAALLDHAVYDSFGQRTDTPAIESSIQWTGMYRDPHTGLQRHGKRWYNPEISRWMSQDWIHAGTNWHAYVGNKATGYVDWSGLEGEGPRLPSPSKGKWLGEPGNSRFFFNAPDLPSVVYRNNQPDLTDYVFRFQKDGKNELGLVEILADCDISKSAKKRHRADTAAADKKMRETLELTQNEWKKARGNYRWHHQWFDETGKMQMVLVKRKVHEAAVHKGAFALWNDFLKAQDAKDLSAIRRASKARRALGFIGKVGGKLAAPVAVFSTFCIAKEGWAADGVPGVFRAVGRDIVFADDVEGVIEGAARGIGNHLNLNDSGDDQRERRRYRSVWDIVYPNGKPTEDD